jgi:hypothetical protein
MPDDGERSLRRQSRIPWMSGLQQLTLHSHRPRRHLQISCRDRVVRIGRFERTTKDLARTRRSREHATALTPRHR